MHSRGVFSQCHPRKTSRSKFGRSVGGHFLIADHPINPFGAALPVFAPIRAASSGGRPGALAKCQHFAKGLSDFPGRLKHGARLPGLARLRACPRAGRRGPCAWGARAVLGQVDRCARGDGLGQGEGAKAIALPASRKKVAIRPAVPPYAIAASSRAPQGRGGDKAGLHEVARCAPPCGLTLPVAWRARLIPTRIASLPTLAGRRSLR